MFLFIVFYRKAKTKKNSSRMRLKLPKRKIGMFFYCCFFSIIGRVLTISWFRNPPAQAAGASAPIPAASSSQQRRTTITAANAAQASTRPTTTTTSQGQQPGYALGSQGAAASNPAYFQQQQSAPVSNEPTRMGTRATTSARKKYGE
jgi:hypothetical protein